MVDILCVGLLTIWCEDIGKSSFYLSRMSKIFCRLIMQIGCFLLQRIQFLEVDRRKTEVGVEARECRLTG